MQTAADGPERAAAEVCAVPGYGVELDVGVEVTEGPEHIGVRCLVRLIHQLSPFCNQQQAPTSVKRSKRGVRKVRHATGGATVAPTKFGQILPENPVFSPEKRVVR